jgi:hypothetical protein
MTKITDLSAASSLTGAEIVPVVQSGTTVRTTVTNLLAAATPVTPVVSDDLLKVSNTDLGLDASLRALVDGNGVDAPLQISSSAVMLPEGVVWPYGDSSRYSGGHTGIIIPFYIYPNNPYTDPVVARLLGLIRQYREVPVIVVINPSSGPGAVWDGNYAALIRVLRAAGACVAGYVSTDYAVRPAGEVQADINAWLTLYADTPISTIFMDEQPYDLVVGSTDTVALYASYTNYCHARNLAPVIGNPGTNQRGEHFASRTADIIVVNEVATYPSEASMLGNFVGGHVDYRYTLRAALVYGQATLVPGLVRRLAKYVQYVLITDDVLPNPWDSLPTYLEQLFAIVAGRDEEISVFGFGASGDGTTDDTAAFTAAVTAAVPTYVPAGAYSLTTNVTGKFDIHPDATFPSTGRAIPSERGFFSNEGPTAIHRLRDRVFVGDAVVQNGAKSPTSSRSWLGLAAGGYMTYLESRSQLEVASSIGGVAGAFGSRTSDNDRASENNTMGVAAYVENDKTGTGVGCWGTYIHAYKSSTTTGSTHGLEVDVATLGTAPMVNPYTTQSMTSGVSAGLWVMSGGEIALTAAVLTPCSLGQYFGNNGSRWLKGIVFATNALERVDNLDDATAATAIQLARGHEIRWAYSSTDSAIAGYVRAIGNDANNIHGIQMSNSGVTLRGPGDLAVLQAQGTASAVNYHYFQNSVTTGSLNWSAIGTDTNIRLKVVPKGSEGFEIASGPLLINTSTVITSTRHPQLRSYTVATLPSAATAAQLIYVSDGTSNKRLAVSDGTNWRWPDGAVVS